MKSRAKMLKATKWTGGLIMLAGIITFIYGFANGFTPITGIGIGTVTGGIFISLIGMFFVAAEEMIENSLKGVKITTPFKPEKGAPL